jgi:2-(1,2-epoxy-1,2-dihydrophenyl)acetyl-CoA isomerase
MNRPDRRNALSEAMVSALGAVLAQVKTDEAVGCVVLTGAGGAFCAGGDVKGMAATPSWKSANRASMAGSSLLLASGGCRGRPHPGVKARIR